MSPQGTMSRQETQYGTQPGEGRWEREPRAVLGGGGPWLGLLALAAVGALVIGLYAAPDIQRYLKIRRM